MTLALGQFMFALGQKESSGDFEYLNAVNGALGKWSILPKRWAAWAAAFGVDATWQGEEGHLNQQAVVTWKLTNRLNQLRLSFPDATTVELHQRLAAGWLGGVSVSFTELATWTDHLKGYVSKVGAILTKHGWEGWPAL